jgi:hypothetical protein
MRLRSGRTKVAIASEQTEEDRLANAIKSQYLVKRTEKEQLRRLIGQAGWCVTLFIAGYIFGLIYKLLLFART